MIGRRVGTFPSNYVCPNSIASSHSMNNPRSQSEGLGVTTNDRVQGKQHPRTDNRSHNPEAIQTKPIIELGYASTTHDKFEHAQNARVEDTQSTRDVGFRLPTDEGSASAANSLSECEESPKYVESDNEDVVSTPFDPLSRAGHYFQDLHISGNAKTHLGDQNYGDVNYFSRKDVESDNEDAVSAPFHPSSRVGHHFQGQIISGNANIHFGNKNFRDVNYFSRS